MSKIEFEQNWRYGYEVAQGRPFGRPTCIPRKYSNSKQSFTKLSSNPTDIILCLHARVACFWAALCATHIPRYDVLNYNIPSSISWWFPIWRMGYQNTSYDTYNRFQLLSSSFTHVRFTAIMWTYIIIINYTTTSIILHSQMLRMFTFNCTFSKEKKNEFLITHHSYCHLRIGGFSTQ